MKKILIALAMTAFAYTGAEAQMVCKPVEHKTTVKHKSATHAYTHTTNRVTACRMIPFQVCTILPDRRSVSCYTTTDSSNQTQTGGTTYYGPTGPMPGEVVHFKVRTIVIKGQPKGSYCKRNSADNATTCYQPGYLIRDENGYYSYGEAVSQDGGVTIK